MFSLSKSFINLRFPLISCTPDGIILDYDQRLVGVVEIKTYKGIKNKKKKAAIEQLQFYMRLIEVNFGVVVFYDKLTN